MAIIGERTRRRIKLDTKGLSGTKEFVVDDWAGDIENYNPNLPRIGDSWSPAYPALRCVNVEARELGAGMGEVTAEYSTDGLVDADAWEESLEFFSETVDQTRSWSWETTGRPVEVQIPTPTTALRYVLRGKVPAPPTDAVKSALNTVNKFAWRGFAPGTLRLDGVNTSATYDSTGAIVSVRTTYTFIWNPRGHNYVWRQALPERDEFGNTVYWQDRDPNRPGYTTDPTKIGSVKYVSGPAGTGGWDRPRYQDGSGWKYRYEESDFAAVLGIPA